MSDRPCLDIPFTRQQFPAFQCSKAQQYAFFDNAGGTYVCGSVISRLMHFYTENKVQPYGSNALAELAGQQMDEGRKTIASLLNVDSSTLTLGPSTTQNINTLSIACQGFIQAGDKLIVSEQDHEANIGAWTRLAALSGAELLYWRVDPGTGELRLDDLDTLLDERVKVVCVTHSSNIIGSINPLNLIAQKTQAIGAKLFVDGVSFAPHQFPDISKYPVDAYFFSTYKTYAPHLGVMYIKPDLLGQLTPQCHYFNTDKPSAVLDSAGPDHAAIASLVGLGDYFEQMHQHHFGPSRSSIYEKVQLISTVMNRHEAALGEMFLSGVENLPIQLLGRTTMAKREANFSFHTDKIPSDELESRLADYNIAVKKGHFYSKRLLHAMGVEDLEMGVVRVSVAHYNTEAEINQLTEALSRIVA